MLLGENVGDPSAPLSLRAGVDLMGGVMWDGSSPATGHQGFGMIDSGEQQKQEARGREAEKVVPSLSLDGRFSDALIAADRVDLLFQMARGRFRPTQDEKVQIVTAYERGRIDLVRELVGKFTSSQVGKLAGRPVANPVRSGARSLPTPR